MPLKDFTGTTPGDDDDDDDTNGSGHGPAQMAFGFGGGGGDDVTDLLIDYNERFANAEPTLFRDSLIEQTLAVLIGKNKPNALLIGSAGVGKTKIVEDVARRIALGDQLIPAQLRGHIVYELPISHLVAGSGIVGELESKVKAVVDFATDPKNKTILFIDEIHTLVDSHNPTYSKIAQILKPALARGDMRVIGATTLQESRNLDTDPAFNRRFTRLTVDELTVEQTLQVLTMVRPSLIAHYKHQVTVDDTVLEQVTRIADANARAGSHRPDTAITLLDRAMASRVLEQTRTISQAAAAGNTTVVTALQSMPSYPLTERKVHAVARALLTGNAEAHEFDPDALEADLQANITGQDSVLEMVVEAMRRESLAAFPRNRPLAWMFAGASGVGKTQTAKLLARHVTDQEPIIINMTEFHSEHSTARLLGAPAGYIGSDSNAELPFDTLESNPHRVILLDEFEKAAPSVQRLFLSALDEGYIKTAMGKTVDFSKAIVIATTNAAREALSNKSLGFTNAWAGNAATARLKPAALNRILMDHFDAELLGRFTVLVGFNPIDEAAYRSVLLTQYNRQRDLVVQSEPRRAALLPVSLDADLVNQLVAETFVADQGARPAERTARRLIEDILLGTVTVNVAAQPAAAGPSVTTVQVLDEPDEGSIDNQG